MNDTMDGNGLVLTRLDFGIISHSSIINKELQKVRMKAIETAQAEMEAIVTERKVCNALIHEVPDALDRVYKKVEELHDYSENKKEWIGCLIVTRFEGKIIPVQTLDGLKTQTFNKF